MLDMLEAEQPASIERDVFPQLVGSGLYGCVSEDYWLDIGTPERYLEATFDILEGTVGTAFAERAGDGYLVVEQSVESEGRIIPSALVERGCLIADGARVGGRVVLESGVVVGANTTIERPWSCAARRSARTARSAAASSAAACGSGTTRTSKGCRCSARASRSAPTT